MTDKEFEQQKKRVKKIFDKWHDALGMGWYKLDVSWSRECDEESPLQIGKCSTNWQYRTAHITFNLPMCEEQEDDRLEEAVVHEMTHVLLGALHDFRDDSTREITEYTTTTVARAIMWAREAGHKDNVAKQKTR